MQNVWVKIVMSDKCLGISAILRIALIFKHIIYPGLLFFMHGTSRFKLHHDSQPITTKQHNTPDNVRPWPLQERKQGLDTLCCVYQRSIMSTLELQNNGMIWVGGTSDGHLTKTEAQVRGSIDQITQ